MPAFNQPASDFNVTRTGFRQGSNTGELLSAGSGSQASGMSSRRPVFLTPDAGQTRQAFDVLQGGVGLNQPQQQAVGVQQSLGRQLQGLLADASGTGQERINRGFQGVADRTSQALARRTGTPQGTIESDAARGVARESGLAVGDLLDRLLGREVQNKQQVTTNITDLLFGSADQATDLINALLGSGGIGNITRALSSSAASSIR